MEPINGMRSVLSGYLKLHARTGLSDFLLGPAAERLPSPHCRVTQYFLPQAPPLFSHSYYLKTPSPHCGMLSRAMPT